VGAMVSAVVGLRVGVPTEGGSLQFRFERGDATYTQLVFMPGLRATVVVDRGAAGLCL
jgi:hypothetical protein